MMAAEMLLSPVAQFPPHLPRMMAAEMTLSPVAQPARTCRA